MNNMADTCKDSLSRSIPVPVNLEENVDLLRTNVSHNEENIISQLQISSLEFSVEKIINSIVTREGCRYYQVKWFDTWIDETSLAEKCQHIIDAYWNNDSHIEEENLSKETGNTVNEVGGELSMLHQGPTEFTEDDKDLLLSQEECIDESEQTDFLNEPITNSYATSDQVDDKKHLNSNAIQEVVIDQSTLLKNPDNVCEVCGKKLSSKKVLKRHVILVHLKNGRHQCTVCNKRFFSSHELSRHMPVHTNIKKFPCKICGKLFKQSGQAYKHWQGHIGEKKFECDKCGNKFLHKNGLLNHYSTHSEERMFECGECKMKFKHKQSVYSHFKRCHSGKRDAICNVCDAGFQIPALLKKHIREVHASALYSCPKCPRKFMVKKFLEKHILKHENGKILPSKDNAQIERREPIYRCEECNSSYTSIVSYQTHLISHQSFQCKVCTQTFLSNILLKDHIKSAHLNDTINGDSHLQETTTVNEISVEDVVCEKSERNIHKCEKCQQTFESKQKLTSHMHLDHITKHQEVPTNHNNDIHVQKDQSKNLNKEVHDNVVMNYKCQICSAFFSNKRLLADHRATHSRKSLVCDVCNKTFKWAYSLARHQEVQHTDGHAEVDHACKETPIEPRSNCMSVEDRITIQDNLPPSSQSTDVTNKRANTDCSSSHSTKISTGKKKKWKQYHEDLFRQRTFPCETCQIHYPTQIELLKHLLSTHKSELLVAKKDL